MIENNRLKPLACIYEIRNKITDSYYIGSAVDYKRRWRNHQNQLNNNIHRNIHLQNAWNKYGQKAFEFSIRMSFCSHSDALNREQFFIDMGMLFHRHKIYNINTSVNGFQGRKHSESTKKVMSEKRMGVSLTKGEKNPNAKLRKDDVINIRNKYKTGVSIASLGREYSVTATNISAIIHHKIWKNL